MAPASRTHLWQTVLAGQWQEIGDASLQDALEAAFSYEGAWGYRFTARGYSYDVDFGRMVQLNLSTKRERKLRRVPDPHASLLSTATVAPSTATVATVAPKTAAVVPATASTQNAAVVPATVPRLKRVSTKKAVPRGKTVAKLSSPPTATAALPVEPAPAAPTSPPSAAPLPQGRVKSFLKEKGYGFIVLDGEEVFFHVSVLLDDSVRVNDLVEVAVAKDRAGRARAKQVRVLRRASIYRQLCRNKCCQAKGERHFEDRCPRGGYQDDDASVSTACS